MITFAIASRIAASLPGHGASHQSAIDAVFDSRAAAGRIVEETLAAWHRRRIS